MQPKESGFYYLQSRYYDPSIGRFINADSYISTGQSIADTNMYMYCFNNPVNLADPTGHNAGAILNWWTSWMWILGLLDLSLPIGEFVYFSVIALLSYCTYSTLVAPTINWGTSEKDEADSIVASHSQPPTVIYRYGGTNPSNLTPKQKDQYSGLSFSTVPRPGAAVTTIEALNATGIVYAVKDGPTHVSVRPVGATMDDWITAGSSSIWTTAVKSVVIKWDGGT